MPDNAGHLGSVDETNPGWVDEMQDAVVARISEDPAGAGVSTAKMALDQVLFVLGTAELNWVTNGLAAASATSREATVIVDWADLAGLAPSASTR